MRANNTPNDGRHPMMSRASEEPEWVDDKPAPRYGRGRVQWVDELPEDVSRPWVMFAKDLRAEPGKLACAKVFDRSDKAYALQRHLKQRYGLETWTRKAKDGSGWHVFAMAAA